MILLMTSMYQTMLHITPLPARPLLFFFFFFNDTATTEIYTLSLHDALPISAAAARRRRSAGGGGWRPDRDGAGSKSRDRKSTRLNSSHDQISYAVFCLKKKNRTPVPVLEGRNVLIDRTMTCNRPKESLCLIH